jgi:hypothetical protein
MPKEEPKTVRVKLIRHMMVEGKLVKKGTTLELPPGVAGSAIQAAKAELVSSEKADRRPPENAMRPGPRSRGG